MDALIRWAWRCACLMVVALIAVASPSLLLAQTTSSLPDIGVDVVALVEDGGTEIGTVLLTVLGIAFVVVLAWIGFRFFRRGAKG